MNVTSDFKQLPTGNRIIALGNFDGVHLGHQALLQEAVLLSHELSGASIALVFDPHPSKVLGYPVSFITSEEEKASLIAATGMHTLFRMPFDLRLATMQPAQFISDVLLGLLGARTVIVGFNYSFGRGGAGTPEFLTEMLAPHGVPVRVVRPVICAGEAVSSTRVRQYIRQGELRLVSQLLGRNYSLTGMVCRGDQRGRLIGYPTANLVLAPERVLPPLGVYAVDVPGIGIGMANLGYRPSFPQITPGLEVHIFDFHGNLYGQNIEVRFLGYLRGERHFSGLPDLQSQLAADRDSILQMIGRKP